MKPEDLSFSLYPAPPAGGMRVGMPNGVTVTHKPSGLAVSCGSQRSQHRNRDLAMTALAAALEAIKVPAVGAESVAHSHGDNNGCWICFDCNVDAEKCPHPPSATPAVASGKYDDVLLPFLKLMEFELHANSGKGDRPGWLSMSRERALLEIYYHVSKLSVAMKNDDRAAIAEHSADVANMAMMALDVCGGLTSTEPGYDLGASLARKP